MSELEEKVHQYETMNLNQQEELRLFKKELAEAKSEKHLQLN